MPQRALSVLGASVLACSLTAPGAAAAPKAPSSPPLPKATNGHIVQRFATGVTTPTSFAFGAGQVFEGDAGNPGEGQASGAAPKPGGVYLLKAGAAKLLPDSPPFVAGLAWHHGTLYVSSARFGAGGTPIWQILAWSGWNGTTFKKHGVIYTAPKDFPGFNGLAIGPDNRLYVGVSLGQGDHGPATAPYQYDILSFRLDGRGPKVFASGIRQPWQIAFAPGDPRPYVTDLGQEEDAPHPPDFVLHVRNGDNYGFPQCNWTDGKRCRGFAKPFAFFAPHTDVGGITIAGHRMYLSEFGMGGKPAQVVALGLDGHHGRVTDHRWQGRKAERSREPRTVLSGFAAPIVGLGAYHDWLYVGSLDGSVYRMHL